MHSITLYLNECEQLPVQSVHFLRITAHRGGSSFMARPKRPRTEAVVAAPPTTRRRRSRTGPAVLGMGVTSHDHDDLPSGRTMDDPTTSSMPPRENPQKNVTALMGDDTHNNNVNSTTAADTTTDNTTGNTTTTGNDHAEEPQGGDDNPGDHGPNTQKKMSLVDFNNQWEKELSASSARTLNNNTTGTTDHLVSNTTNTKRIVTNDTSDNNHEDNEDDNPAMPSKVVHSTTTTTIDTTTSSATLNHHHSHSILQKSAATRRSSSTSHDETSIAKTSTIRAAAEPENIVTLDSTEKNDEPTRSTTAVEQDTPQWRKEHVVALLEHRQMLLQRVRQCRQVTERRLSTEAVKSIDREKETVIFTDTMRQVLSLARKQARLEQQQQRDGGVNHNNNKNTGSGSNNNNNNNSNTTMTTTVSLRRGNSVGKRMNAAISTLTGTASHAQHGSSSSSTGGMAPLKLVASYMNNNDGDGGGSGDGTERAPKKRSDSAQSRTVPKKSLTVRGPDYHHHLTTLPPPPSQRQRINNNADGHSINQQQQYTSSQQHSRHQNRVICPETMALRNRRDEIRDMLSTLLKQRQHRPKLDKGISLSERRNSLMSHVSSASLSPRSTVISSKPTNSASLHRTSRHGNEKVNHKLISSSSSPVPIWENPHGPPNLPPRRKTHWDTVLEEMRWMATDFIEEQKWKYAACRVLSMQASAVVSSSQKKKQPPPTKHPPVPPLIANAMETTNTGDMATVDESKTNDVKESRSTAIKFNASVVLSNFQPMTIDDSISARNIAQQISDIISNMVNLNNLSFTSSIANNVANRLQPSTNSAPLNRVDITDPTFDFSKHIAEFMQRVSSHIDNVLTLASDQEVDVNEITTPTEEKCDIQPTMEQIKILQMIEYRWEKRIGIGTVLHGPRASGKTILACSAMYRNRSHGPQLLLCSSESVIRWTHELDNFKGLHVKHWHESESGATSMKSLGANDVLICPRSSVVNLRWDDLAKFCAIILDCRYANQSSPQLLSESRTEQSICVPYDISSQVWWRMIVDVVSNCDISRRLLVDSLESDNTLTYLRGLTSKEFLGVAALRTAFLVGPKCFVTPIYPIEKAILAWARHRTKQDVTGTVGSKFSQVDALLTKVCESCRSNAGSDMDNFDCLGKFVTYDVRYCTMTKTQRFSYDRACQQSRLSLSQELEAQNEKLYEVVATSLLLLRRHCIHSNIEAILDHATLSCVTVPPNGDVDTESHKYLSQQIFGQNAAQPNLELAYKILSGSSKLRQLVSILHDNEGYMPFGHSDIKCVGLQKSCVRWTSNQIEQRKKIVIVASQPDIQILVSCLLHSIGMHHEILTTNWSTQSALIPGHNKDSRSWLSVQALLSKFNGRGESNGQILITSLAMVEGDRVGLGIEAADSIIILDEDWSGQEERPLHSVLSRCFHKRKSIGKSGVHVTRLVTECTCEDVFLRHKTGDPADNNLTSWFQRHYSADVSNSSTSINRTVAPSLITNGKRDPEFLICCFPGQNILRHRNVALDDVLKPTRSLSRLHSYSTNGRFLPIASEHNLADIESMIISCLARLELCSRGNYDKIERLSPVAAHEIESWHEDHICLPPTPLRDFVRQQYEAMVLQESGTIFSLANVALATKGATHAVEASDHIDRATRPVLAKSPIDAAASILVYGYDTATTDLGSATSSAVSHRGNRYAASFSTTGGVSLRHDGNQGVESLVYFPPIFPKLRESVDAAIPETGLALQHQTPQDGESDGCLNTAGVHREGAESSYLEADSGLAVAGVFPSFQDSVTHAAGTVVHTGSSNVKSIDTWNEWISSIYPTNAEEYQTILQDRIANESMQSVILMVNRKRQRGQSNSSYQARYGTGAWSGIPASISDMSRTIDANGVNKKGKKVVSAFNRLPLLDAPQHSRLTAFTSQRKDDYRHRLLMTLRQSGTSSGSTIFDAPIFRVAAVRIRDKISARLQRQNWITSSTRVNDKSCSGLPIDSNSRTGVVGRYNVSTEILDRQIHEMARQQTITFQKSPFEPRRIDFGPFQLGFVSSMLGMTSVTYPRPRIGVTLPMGVKISIISKEQTSGQWSQDMDRILMHTITRFGSNWLLASLRLKGFFGVPNSHKESTFYSSPCAPRTCRDRWRLLTSDEDSQRRSSNTMGSSKDIQLGGDTGRRILVSKQNNLEYTRKNRNVETYLLVPSSIDDVLPTRKVNGASSLDEPSSPTKHKSSRRTFTAFKHGLRKQQKMPTPISAVTSVVASCHPSHELTVQMSTMAVNGRTDMWPLQILDGAERLRSAAAAAASSANIESTSSTSGQSGVPSRRTVTANMPTRVHSSTNNNVRSVVPPPPNHRSHSTTAAPIPLQRTTSSNSTSASQRPSSQHSYQPANHVTASKQRFVPSVPPTKVVATPKVQIANSNGLQIATSNPMAPPQTMASQKPSKSINAAHVTVSSQPSPPVVPAATSETVASKCSTGTIASDQSAPSKALSVPPQPQVSVSPEVDHKVSTTPKSATDSTVPFHKTLSNAIVLTATTTIPALSGDVSATTTTTTSEILMATGAVVTEATAVISSKEVVESSAAVPASNQP